IGRDCVGVCCERSHSFELGSVVERPDDETRDKSASFRRNARDRACADLAFPLRLTPQHGGRGRTETVLRSKPPHAPKRRWEAFAQQNLHREDLMATNLVTLVMQFLTPEMIGRVATALGLDRTLVQSVISAAVPGLLAGFSGVATQPGGAQKLVEAAKQETGTLGKFADMLGGGGQSNLIERGSQLLTSLLGARDQSALVGAIGQFAGLGQGKSGSLLGMLAPIVMGTVAQQQSARGPDASSIANLFASQKDNIAAALPADFGRLLGGTDLLNSLGGAARAAASAGTQATRAAGASASAAGNASQPA